jgi:hypothetical protein
MHVGERDFRFRGVYLRVRWETRHRIGVVSVGGQSGGGAAVTQIGGGVLFVLLSLSVKLSVNHAEWVCVYEGGGGGLGLSPFTACPACLNSSIHCPMFVRGLVIIIDRIVSLFTQNSRGKDNRTCLSCAAGEGLLLGVGIKAVRLRRFVVSILSYLLTDWTDSLAWQRGKDGFWEKRERHPRTQSHRTKRTNSNKKEKKKMRRNRVHGYKAAERGLVRPFLSLYNSPIVVRRSIGPCQSKAST